jgi:hypothetical protein
MKANTFVVMGHTRSLWAFYHGMGLAVTIFLTAEAIVFWVLGTLVRDSDTDLRDLLVVFVIGYMALAANSLRFFFYPPLIIELLIAACLVMAILSIKTRRYFGQFQFAPSVFANATVYSPTRLPCAIPTIMSER